MLKDLNNSERAVDLNHIYSLSAMPAMSKNKAQTPRNLLSITPPSTRQKVGIVDTQLNMSHPSLQRLSITSKDFSEQIPISTSSHGNSVVSILAGQSDDFVGLLSNVDIYAASVFFHDDESGDITTTESLLNSLDWLISQDVKVINMSLAGPANMVLSAAIGKYCEQGIIIVAAVGNNGPHSEPLFPAADECVIGVTAISESNRVYRRAVRGPQVDIASYGVNILAADKLSGYSSVTGTSFATPFVTAQVLSLLTDVPVSANAQKALTEELMSLTIDLGEPGKDIVYGFGALTHKSSTQK